jgi:hypothetical protein
MNVRRGSIHAGFRWTLLLRVRRGSPPLAALFAAVRPWCDLPGGGATHDPVALAAPHADVLRSMRTIHIEAGNQDEYFLDLGTRGLSEEYERLEIPHSFEIFDGAHDDVEERMPSAVANLIYALSQP